MTKQRTPILTTGSDKNSHKDNTPFVPPQKGNLSHPLGVKTIPQQQAEDRKASKLSHRASRIVEMSRGIGDQPKPVHYVIVLMVMSKLPVVLTLEEASANKIGGRFTEIGIALRPDEIAEIREFACTTGPEDIKYDVQTQVGFNGTHFAFPFSGTLPDAISPKGGRRRLAHFSENALHGDFKSAGLLKKWQELERFARGNSRLIFLFAVACAGPLSGLLGHLPMTFILFARQGGDGKSASAAIASSMWGWNNDEFGFGQSCNGTPIGVQGVLASRRHSLTVLDEPGSNDDPKKCAHMLVSGTFQAAGGAGRVRQRQGGDGVAQVERTAPMETVVVITSNATAAEIVGWTGSSVGTQHHDRMITISAPANAEAGFFETLHGEPDAPALVHEMKKIAKENHGVAAQRLVRRLEAVWAKDQERFKRAAEKLEKTYLDASAEFASDASLKRLNRTFARVYVAGVVGIKTGVLRFETAELLAAVLKCHRDCLPFRTTPVAGPASPSDLCVPLASLERFWAENSSTLPTLNDGRFNRSNPPPDKQAFISKEKSRRYLALADKHFVELCAGKRPADALKAHLAAKGVLVRESAGSSTPRYVVKRQIGKDLDAQFVLISLEAFDETVEDF